jgi:CheY-like chemotaxis protein
MCTLLANKRFEGFDMTALGEPPVRYRPTLLLALPPSDFATLSTSVLGRLGWNVLLADSGQQARRLARAQAPEVVVLAIDLPDESGWLTCEKLIQESPGQQVILVTGQETPFHADFAKFVGAVALVHEADGVAALIDEIRGAALMAAAS